MDSFNANKAKYFKNNGTHHGSASEMNNGAPNSHMDGRKLFRGAHAANSLTEKPSLSAFAVKSQSNPMAG